MSASQARSRWARSCCARAEPPARPSLMIEITAGVFDGPPAFQPAVDQDPMTGRGSTPAVRRAAKARQIVVAMNGRPRRDAPRLDNAPRACLPEFCEFLEHRSPPLPPSRGRPVRSRRSVRARPPIHAGDICAISLAVLRRQVFRHRRSTVARVATAHVPSVPARGLVGVRDKARCGTYAPTVGHYARHNGLSSRFCYPPGRIMIILPGG
jgi:hypothetical protein